MMEGGLNQGPHKCKEKLLTNELLHTITHISPIIHQI
jgi:hypothetical protein